MSTFSLAISCLTYSNLPWFMDLTFQVPMQYCPLQHWTSITSHNHNWVLFLLWLHLFILSGVISISPVSSSSIGHLWTWGVHLSVSYLFAFSYCSWGSQGKNIEVDHVLSELSTMIRPSWVALHGMAHSFIELEKAVVHVIRLVSILWLWFSVCLLSDGEV